MMIEYVLTFRGEITGMHQYYVYIMSSPTGTLYTGMTNDLMRRVFEHQQKLIDGFTKTYNVTRLIYYEETDDVKAAIFREKQIKSWGRSKKLALVRSVNPTFRDLSEGWFE
jgi:putative endonuclease